MKNLIDIHNACTLFLTQWVQPIFLLLLRFWLAWIFFKSGLTKISSIDSTLALFEYEYAVPIIPYDIAAWLSIIVELALPPLLAIGLACRPTALILLIFNAVAMVSYPDISHAGVKEHELWQMGFLVIFIFGAGKLSVDAFLAKYLTIEKD